MAKRLELEGIREELGRWLSIHLFTGVRVQEHVAAALREVDAAIVEFWREYEEKRAQTE